MNLGLWTCLTHVNVNFLSAFKWVGQTAVIRTLHSYFKTLLQFMVLRFCVGKLLTAVLFRAKKSQPADLVLQISVYLSESAILSADRTFIKLRLKLLFDALSAE